MMLCLLQAEWSISSVFSDPSDQTVISFCDSMGWSFSDRCCWHCCVISEAAYLKWPLLHILLRLGSHWIHGRSGHVMYVICPFINELSNLSVKSLSVLHSGFTLKSRSCWMNGLGNYVRCPLLAFITEPLNLNVKTLSVFTEDRELYIVSAV